jgi:hypothetical protein
MELQRRFLNQEYYKMEEGDYSTVFLHLVALSNPRHLWARTEVVLEFHFADIFILASHLDALELAASSSLGYAANLVGRTADCAAFSQIRLSNAVDVIVAFALVAGRGGGFELDTVASSCGGSGRKESVVVLGDGDSSESESEKLHFFYFELFFFFVSLYLMVNCVFHAVYIQ